MAQTGSGFLTKKLPEHYRLTCEALAYMDAGKLINHQDIEAWAMRLHADNLCLPRITQPTDQNALLI